ncbi:MAG: hypothetical protein P4L84_11080 [Isosphaeraceae bacterium]|nr:hypothetical protein [Isosphaeraceae bacterium]
MSFPLDLPIAEFQIPTIEPVWLPEVAPADEVVLAASAVYPAGSLIGELTATPGTFGLYTGGLVGAVTVTAAGTGYTSPPTVAFTGTAGTGATAVAYVSGGAVVGVVVTNGGDGYESAPTIAFTAVNGGSGATATATIAGGAVVGITVTGAGSGYLAAPTVRFSGGAGGATATATLTAVTPTLVAGGATTYLVGDVLTVVGGTFTTAATIKVLTVSSGEVATFAVLNGGAYSVIPTGTLSTTGGGGTGCTLTLVWGVGAVSVTAGGSDYTVTPTVGFSGGAGSGATATATLSYATDGTQSPTAIVSKSCATDASGAIWDGEVAGVSQFGESQQSVKAFFGGYFRTFDCPNIDAHALSVMGGSLKRGSLASDTGIFHF